MTRTVVEAQRTKNRRNAGSRIRRSLSEAGRGELNSKTLGYHSRNVIQLTTVFLQSARVIANGVVFAFDRLRRVVFGIENRICGSN